MKWGYLHEKHIFRSRLGGGGICPLPPLATPLPLIPHGAVERGLAETKQKLKPWKIKSQRRFEPMTIRSSYLGSNDLPLDHSVRMIDVRNYSRYNKCRLWTCNASRKLVNCNTVNQTHFLTRNLPIMNMRTCVACKVKIRIKTGLIYLKIRVEQTKQFNVLVPVQFISVWIQMRSICRSWS